jgi:hypothetical protein
MSGPKKEVLAVGEKKDVKVTLRGTVVSGPEK